MDWMIWTAIGCCAVAFVINAVLLVQDVKRYREAKREEKTAQECPIVWHVEGARVVEVIDDAL